MVISFKINFLVDLSTIKTNGIWSVAVSHYYLPANMTNILHTPIYFKWWDVDIPFSGTILTIVKIAVMTNLALI